ncbi:MAG: GWxTD domain-containing protein [Acidobacteria bacterium]|nr:GWxTD domain-containing protein [Acidobacteriota bacterium]
MQAAATARADGQRVHDQLEVSRWALSLAFLLLMLLFLSLLVFFFLPAEAEAKRMRPINFDRPTKDWYQGPVRYLTSKQEVKAYKSLDNELDRRNFIDWFWQRRDVIPATRENEFRDRFERRVFESERKFSHTSKPGWKTDMGKIYILVGPPDDVVTDAVGKGHRGVITWSYRNPPFPDLRPNTVVAFAKDASGEFVLSTSPTLDSDVARGLRFNRVKLTADGRYYRPGRDPILLDQGVPLSQGEMQTMFIYGRLQQLPPGEEEMFQDIIFSREFYGTIPMDSRMDFYKSEDERTFSTLTVGIKSASVQYRDQDGVSVPDVGVFGKLVNKDNPEDTYPLASDSAFAGSPTNAEAGPSDLLIFQATGGFPPGRYQLVLGVEDRVSGKIAAYRKDVVIPDLTGEELMLSTVTLASTLEPQEHFVGAGRPFRLGRFLLVPQPDNIFHRDDELNLYFQIYSPGIDPEIGSPRLDVLYTFRHRQKDGTLVNLGSYQVQDSRAQVQGYAVPLKEWLEGEYVITISVFDRVRGKPVSDKVEFVIR